MTSSPRGTLLPSRGADPVHLTPLGYEKLDEQLSQKAAENKLKKRTREDVPSEQQSQRPRLNSDTRLAGISKSEAFPNRWEKPDGCGGHPTLFRGQPSRTSGGQSGHARK